MQQVHLIISGLVQGVNFRYFVKSNAEALDVKGWVRNTETGQVEVLLQGDKQAIVKLVTLCHKGPMLAEVKSVEVKEEEVSEIYRGFEVRV